MRDGREDRIQPALWRCVGNHGDSNLRGNFPLRVYQSGSHFGAANVYTNK
jgi:hypothetical protein